MKECHLYKKLKENKVQCQNCAHYCLIETEQRGKCGVRENKDGKLYSLVYGKPIAIAIDPIEKKPFYHFMPGTKSLSIATVGCNFTCYACQNWQISQVNENHSRCSDGGLNMNNRSHLNQTKELSPQKIVEMAQQNNLPSISYTYTEPAIFSEYALDIMKLAHRAGLKNCWVSNGFWSKELANLLLFPLPDSNQPLLDAANIDLKSFSDEFYQKYCGGRLQPVLDTLKRIAKAEAHLEITFLIIPTLNDNPQEFTNIANFIKNKLGAEIPWHISRFSGAISWKLKHLSDTPAETLKKAEVIGKKIGLKNVHLGNV